MLHGMYMYFACTITVYTSVVAGQSSDLNGGQQQEA